MLLHKVQEAAELRLSVSPSVPALLLWCGAGWGGREEAVLAAPFTSSRRTVLQGALCFIVPCLQTRS